MNKLQNDLRNLLFEVLNKADCDFSGIGLLVYEKIENIPIVNLRETMPKFNVDLTETLSIISSNNSEYHDGFHLINTNWEITHISQYFSPPILKGIQLNRSRKIGGRYVAALYGSGIEGILLTGIASNSFGVAIFKDGVEIYFESLE